MKGIILHPHELLAHREGRLDEMWRAAGYRSKGSSCSCVPSHWTMEPSAKPGEWIVSIPGSVLGAKPTTAIARSPFHPGETRRVKERCRFFTDLGTFNVRYADGETAQVSPPDDWMAPEYEMSSHAVEGDEYPAGLTEYAYGCRASHMPSWSARHFLRVVAVEARRVQTVTFEEAMGWGIDTDGGDDEHRNRSTRENFEVLWDQLNPRKPWSSNPWAWRVRVEKTESEAKK